MPSVLIQKIIGGEAVYTRLEPIKPDFISQAFNYDGDDVVSELNRKTENQKVIKEVVNKLRLIKDRASKGFGSKDLSRQLRVIEKSKFSIFPILSEGSFYISERERILEIAYRMIDRYYEPYLNKKLSY